MSTTRCKRLGRHYIS